VNLQRVTVKLHAQALGPSDGDGRSDPAVGGRDLFPQGAGELDFRSGRCGSSYDVGEHELSFSKG
jgi:hypothetical protein